MSTQPAKPRRSINPASRCNEPIDPKSDGFRTTREAPGPSARGRLPVSNNGLEAIGEMVEQQPDAARGVEMFVHGKPDLERELDIVRQNWNEFRPPQRERVLTTADAHAG